MGSFLYIVTTLFALQTILLCVNNVRLFCLVLISFPFVKTYKYYYSLAAYYIGIYLVAILSATFEYLHASFGCYDLPSQMTTHLCLLSRECLYNLLSLMFSILALFVVKPWPLGLSDLDSNEGHEEINSLVIFIKRPGKSLKRLFCSFLCAVLGL